MILLMSSIEGEIMEYILSKGRICRYKLYYYTHATKVKAKKTLFTLLFANTMLLIFPLILDLIISVGIKGAVDTS